MASGKEQIESWNDVRNRFDDLLKRPIHRFAWHQDILNRYVQGDVVLHFHCRDLFGGGQCVTVKAVDRRADVTLAIGDVREDGRVSDGQDGHSMFVVVREMMQPPQRLIPSVARLTAMDFRNRRCGNLALRKTIRSVHIPGVTGVGGKRESGNSSVVKVGDIKGRIEVLRHQFPEDVVESGPTIADAIPDDGAEAQGRLRHQQDVGVRFVCDLGFDFVRALVQVHGDFGFQRIDMFLSPDDFEP